MKTITALAALSLSLASFGTVAPAGAEPLTYGPDTCRQGYVWREASFDDHVCVRPASRSLVKRENRTANSRIDPAGAYGPYTCINGFVWREAFAGDVVCVTPERRAAVAAENANAANTRVLS